MSFHESCVDIRIEVRGDHTVLLAGAGVGDNAYQPAELVLDKHIGYFTWDERSFTETAENIELSFREDGVWLEADLPEIDGESGRQGINLSERIENQNGRLVFI